MGCSHDSVWLPVYSGPTEGVFTRTSELLLESELDYLLTFLSFGPVGFTLPNVFHSLIHSLTHSLTHSHLPSIPILGVRGVGFLQFVLEEGDRRDE